MYKRPVRILFLGLPGDDRIRTAARLVAGIAPGWAEGRAITVNLVDTDALAWADLVIPLDDEARDRCPPLPPTARMKPWNLPETSPEETERIITGRIRAMLGGLRMLSRMDQ